MSMMEPFLPHPARDETIAAADPGTGAPETAPGFGVEGEEPDVAAGAGAGAGGAAQAPAGSPDDVPFRTPDPDEVGRPG